jgi:SAM-dependent methyltransferase
LLQRANARVTHAIANRALCPRCRTLLDAAISCPSCGQSYPCAGGIRVLMPDPSAHLDHWRMQLGLVIQQASATNHALKVQAAERGVGEATQTRLLALTRAIAEQVADVAAVLVPAIGDPLPPRENVGLPRGAGDYISCLFRDWAGSNAHDEENNGSLSAIRRVTRGKDLGRMLVLGAGGCRLAYDLHLRCGGTETVVVDVDPFLLAIAEAVIRGAAVGLTETSANAPAVETVSRSWKLSAPAGPLSAAVFHFFLADGTEPPFADRSFDTVVTPWFIDQVPTDLDALLRRVHALLAPGGRWINHGPLIYRPDTLAIARWYTRQEIFELAAASGFRMGAWETAVQPHLVSPLTGRGLIENVLTFEATRA